MVIIVFTFFSNDDIRDKTVKRLMIRRFTQQPVVNSTTFQQINSLIVQMQLMKFCVWAIFYFRQTKQIVGGHTVILCQCNNSPMTDNLILNVLVSADCRTGDISSGGNCSLIDTLFTSQIFQTFGDCQLDIQEQIRSFQLFLP